MSRVAVIGSCITRDLWPILGLEVSDLLYVSRTSLASLFAAPIGPVETGGAPPAALRPGQHRALVADLTKTALAALVAHRPSHIVFDFIDERFDLLAVGAGLATHSWELEASGYLAEPAFAARRSIPRMSPACDLLWRDGLEELAAFIAATPLREAQLVLHEAQWATGYRTVGGGRARFPDEIGSMEARSASLAAHNGLLSRYQAAFRTRFPQAAAVAAPSRRIADAGHRWGLSPFHYIDDYYREIWDQLAALGV